MITKKQDIKPGDVVVYICKNIDEENNIETIYKAEIGVVKRISYPDRRAFVWYHSGDTAAGTNLDDLIKIDNYYQIDTHELGGSR